MNEQSRQDHNKSKGQTKQPERAAVAARDPRSGAVNRPGFDLGGAVDDAKSDDKSRNKSSKVQAQDAVDEHASMMTGGSQIEAEGKAGFDVSNLRRA